MMQESKLSSLRRTALTTEYCRRIVNILSLSRVEQRSFCIAWAGLIPVPIQYSIRVSILCLFFSVELMEMERAISVQIAPFFMHPEGSEIGSNPGGCTTD
jgi:hypothetical protein